MEMKKSSKKSKRKSRLKLNLFKTKFSKIKHKKLKKHKSTEI